MARHWNAGTDNLQITNNAAFNGLRPMTLSVWFTFESGLGAAVRLIGKGSGAAGNGNFIITISSTTLLFGATGWQTTVGQWTTNVGNIFTTGVGMWHNLIITYNYGATSDNPTFIIDGTIISPSQTAAPAGTLGTDTVNINVGNNGGGTSGFTGSICELALWSVVLNSQELQALAAGITADQITAELANLKGYWPLRGASPEPDLSGNGNNSNTPTGTTIVDHAPITRMQRQFQSIG